MENDPSYSEKSSGASGSGASGNRSSKPSSPSFLGSGPLSPRVSHQDLGVELEPCYSIALGDREPRSSIFKSTVNSWKKPLKISLDSTSSAEYDNSPRFLMTPRKSDLSSAFSLAHSIADGDDTIDDIFGEHRDEGNQWGIGVLGAFTGIIMNILAMVFAFLLPNTGHRRTWFCFGVLLGAIVQSATLVYLILIRSSK